MLFPTFRRLFKTDYPQEQQELVDKLSVTINNGFEVIYNAMSHNVSLADNLFQTTSVLQVRVDASGNPVTPLSFKINTTGNIKGNQVIQARNLTNPNIPVTGCPFLTYTQDGQQINVSNVAGLPAGYTFEMTVNSWG